MTRLRISAVFRGFELNERYRETRDLADAWAHFRVVLDPLAPQTVDAYPHLASKLLETYPRMRAHACDNAARASFATELKTTEIAHAFEHLTAELLAQESQRSRLDIVGQTAWNFSLDGHGVYRVRIQGFQSEEQARRLSQRACIILEDLAR